MSVETKPIPSDKKTNFRKYAATIMASVVVGGVVYGWLTGMVTGTEEGIAGGILIGLAAKYLWEESGA